MKDASGVELLQKITTFGYDNNGNELRRSVEYISLFNKANPKAYEAAVYSDDTTEPIHAVVDQTTSKYDGFNRLVSTELIKATTRTTVEYAYNGDGLRVEKTVKRSDKGNTAEVTSYLYDRQHVILETRGSDNIRYARGINYIGRIDNTDKLSYFMYNGHGDVVQTVSEAGEIENQYDYDIFGNPTLTVESYLNSIRYAGEFYDSETGLYYLRARYYDPYIGRFISEDSYWGEDSNPLSLNLYTYAHNDPIRYIDPTGHLAIVDDDTVYNPYTGNIINTRTGEKTSLKDKVEEERKRKKDEEERRRKQEQRKERERIENKLKEFRAALEKALKEKEKSMVDKLKQQLDDLETDIEKYSQIDGVGAEELKNKVIPELGTTLSRDTKGYNVYVDLMQYKLNKLGYTDANGNKLAEDGKFGKNTEYAVNKFKETNKLWNDKQYKGKVGETSYDMLFSGKAKRAPEEKTSKKNGQNTGPDPSKGTTPKNTNYPGGTIGLGGNIKPEETDSPVDNNKVISPYGLIKPIISGKEAGYGEETFEKPEIPYHRSDSGLDISSDIGTPCVAAADGTIVYSELGHTSWRRQDPKTGEYIDTPYSVLIKLDKPITYKDGRTGYYLYYTHLSKLEFEKLSSDKKETHVKQGDVIGYSGIANNSPHLHLGIIIEKKQKNYPTDYFSMPEVREMLGIKRGESW